MQSLKSMIMHNITTYYDQTLGGKYTGYTLLINFNGTLEDMDESGIKLLERSQGKNDGCFIHKVRTII